MGPPNVLALKQRLTINPLTREDDLLFCEHVASCRGNDITAAKRIYNLSGDPSQVMEFIRAKLDHPNIERGVQLARLALTEEFCLTRAEKRSKLAAYVREHDDPDVVLKSIQTDNKMTGDEIPDTSVNAVVYVARVGDEVIDVSERDDDCV